jgi:hypothetical protein
MCMYIYIHLFTWKYMHIFRDIFICTHMSEGVEVVVDEERGVRPQGLEV